MLEWGGFTGDSDIQLSDSSLCYVKDVVVGDRVWGGDRIEEIVRIPVYKEVEMVIFNTGLKITPWHPIKSNPNDDWTAPCTLDYISKYYVTEYYNIKLENEDSISLNGFEVATIKKN